MVNTTAPKNTAFLCNYHFTTFKVVFYHAFGLTVYKIGDKIMLSTLNRRNEYKTKGKQRAAKFMPHYDGPYVIIDTHFLASTVMLDMPNTPNLFPTFHTAHIKPWHTNDDVKYPSRTLALPGPIEVEGSPEYFVDAIIDHKKMGKGYRYLVRFVGYGPEHDRWIAGRDLEDNAALDTYWDKQPDD